MRLGANADADEVPRGTRATVRALGPDTPTGPVPLVLLVHPDAAAFLAAHPDLGADVAAAAGAKEARAYLAGTAFDVVYVGPDVEGAEAIGALRDVLGLSTRVESLDRLGELPDRLAQGASAEGGREALEHVRGELSRVAHALNNPLAVISGNAQLGREMATATGADESVVDVARRHR